MIRATEDEKQYQIATLDNLHTQQQEFVSDKLKHIQATALAHENIFEQLMDAAKVCSLGQITDALFEVGGQYRRNM